MTDLSYSLLVDGAPASPDLLAAVQQIEVEDHVDMAGIMRLRLAIAVREDGSGYALLDEDLFERLTRIVLKVTVGSSVETLLEAYAIEASADISNEPGSSTLDVVAMDATVLMSLEEKIRPWPDMSDSDIATAIFGDQEYGFEPVVEETSWRRQEIDQLVIQRGTDIRFLKHLARCNGFECYVEANPNTGRLEGHFHPPRLKQEPQGVLSVSLSSATNVNSFNARFNMIRPAAAQAKGLDIETQSDQQAQEESSSLAGLGRDPTLTGDRPRKLLLSQTGLVQTGELQTCARAVVDRSCWAITAEGELNTVAYGGILRAKRPVLVRGAGRMLSGAYYVEKVLHIISGEGYTQRFTLRRNATGLTDQEDFAASILERL